ncbi:glycosyltransferase family 4 protein [Pendulispora rubella]|uniref:Glycosyltransferase family 4 protein n=1 Tax=Pendulispora rubella TaxID=2741070 RepID=A0ABZ2KUZ1_9BACT
MRIVIAAPVRTIVGGAETYLRALMPALLARGHQVALLYERDAGDPTMHIDRGLDIPRWQTRGESALPAGLIRWQPDVVYAQGLGFSEVEDALLEAYPAALFVHAHRGTCISGSKTHAFPEMRECERTLGPGCLAYYFARRCGGLNPVTTVSLYARERGHRRRMARYRAVFVASRHMEHELVHNGIPGRQIHRNPIPPYEAVPISRPPQERSPTNTILYVGRLVRSKGCHHLIEAMPRVCAKLGRPLRLVVAGSGPAEEEFQAQARRTNADIQFVSWVDARTRQTLMEAADLLVLPTLMPETFGMVGVEAGCAGLPTVAYAMGGVAEWLEPGVSGEFAHADPPTSASLAEAMVRALRDPVHHLRLRNGAWEMARTITSEEHLGRLERVLERISQASEVRVMPKRKFVRLDVVQDYIPSLLEFRAR